jgi:hypothetical protein
MMRMRDSYVPFLAKRPVNRTGQAPWHYKKAKWAKNRPLALRTSVQFDPRITIIGKESPLKPIANAQASAKVVRDF